MTGFFETQTFQVCPTEPIICVKEFAYGSPKLHAIPETHATFLNANIMFNLRGRLQSCEKL